MSEATSLYRRHRPGSFDQVVGQRHVVRTLSNAVEQGKIHHAYLFVGSRGTGKTSMAKILAASLNCENGGPTVSPCGTCESCRSIAAGTSVDVIEMDAASNRSVDDVRELRERVAYAPAGGRWKVYILDEAHMLTKEAWNAFLKTLEEPPPNTVFILATTEAHKVMPTIADRCQRFDFQRPSLEQIAEVLERVSAAEGIEMERPAVAMVARSASGSFRDALGTLGQLVSYGGNSIALDDVLEVLGAPDADLVFGCVDAIAAADPKAVLAAVEGMAATGRDPARFARDLLGHLRLLLVTQTTGEVPEAFSVTAGDGDRISAQAAAVGPATLVRTIDELAAALANVREGDDARLAVEIALIKAAKPELDPGSEGLARRIERLERALEGMAAPPAPRPSAAAAPAASAPAPDPEPDGPEPEPEVEELADDAAAVDATEGPEAPAPEPDPAPMPEPAAEPGEAEMPAEEDAPEPPRADELGLERLVSLWPTVLDTLKGESAGPIATYFEGTRPVRFDDAAGQLDIGFPPDAAFNKRNAEKPERRDLLVAALHAVTGQRLRPTFELMEAPHEGGEPSDQVDEQEFLDRVKSEFNAEEVI